MIWRAHCCVNHATFRSRIHVKIDVVTMTRSSFEASVQDADHNHHHLLINTCELANAKHEPRYEMIPEDGAETAAGSVIDHDDDDDDGLNVVPTVVFSCSSKYHVVVILLLAISPIVCALSVIPVWLDPTASLNDKWVATSVIAASSLLILVLYMAVCPYRLDVRSDASIVVVTFLCPHVFPHVARAYQLESLASFESMFRPRIKFATDLNFRIVVRRRRPYWDIIVSPADPSGFLAAVERVVEQRDNHK